MSSASRIVKPGEGREFRVLGNTFLLKVTAAETQDAYSVFEIASPPRGGIPPHINTREAETHIVLQGRYGFQVAAETHEVGPGAVFYLPRGIAHGFHVLGPEHGRMIVIPSPGSNNEAFVAKLAERFGDALPAGGPDPATWEALAALAREYGSPPAPPSG